MHRMINEEGSASLQKIIEELFERVGLGKISGEIIPVSGGFMHRMYKVCSTLGVYAVKCLNPDIMKRPGVFENYSAAEELEARLESAGIPIVPALSFGKKKMVEVAGRYFYIFRWQEGRITGFDNITEEQCFTAGSILGKIHAIDPHEADPEEPDISNIDFKAYASEASEKNSDIAELLKNNISLLEGAQDKLNDARKNLPGLRVIDDPDMDPKNIMWNEGKAYVIDLECLERGNPVSSSLNLALQWAGTVTGKYNRENLKAFYEGYLKEYDNGFRTYDRLFGIAYTWVEWLEYNIRRALGIESADAEDMKLGAEEVRRTIERIRYLSSIEGDVCDVLAGL